MLAFGFTLNTMSLLGLSLAIGILIDDAIVVRENIVRHVEMGKDHYTAAHEGTDGDRPGGRGDDVLDRRGVRADRVHGRHRRQWFEPFALTIACSVLVSLFVSFSLDPMLSAYWPDPHLPTERALVHLARARRVSTTGSTGRPIATRASSAGRSTTASRWRLWRSPSFVGALAMPALGHRRRRVLPGVRQLRVLDQHRDAARIEPRLHEGEGGGGRARSRARCRGCTTRTRRSAATPSAVDEAMVYVRLTPKHSACAAQQDRGAACAQRAGPARRRDGEPSAAAFDNTEADPVQLQGPDSRELEPARARCVEAEVQQVPGAVDVGLSTRGQKPELDVAVDRGLAGTLGVTRRQTRAGAAAAFAGLDVRRLGRSDRQDARRERAAGARGAGARQRSRVAAAVRPRRRRDGSVGRAARPGGAASEPALGPARIDHLDRERVISIQANTEGAPLTEVLSDIKARCDAVPLPAGYIITQGGQSEDQSEVFGQILTALGVAVLLMYLVLVVQFGSFLDPLAIMLSLPLSLIGVMLALLVTGSTRSTS